MKKITIQNLEIRKDIHGDIIDAHDGCLEYHDGLYWLYGTQYGDTDGYQLTNILVSYSSPDLERWTPHGALIPDAMPTICYRPYVKYCAATGKWVMWHYWTPSWKGTTKWRAGDGPIDRFRFAVSIADRPEGPYTTICDDEPLSCSSKGDLNLFVDDDGTAYIVHSSPQNGFRIVVEKLTSDYLHSTGDTSHPIAEGMEAPCMFRRGDYYYVLVGVTCCFCPQGAGAQVFRAIHPLGPFEARNNINRVSRDPGAMIERPYPIIIPGQQTNIAKLHTAGGDSYIWMADLWESATDGVKGHDIQYWSSPLSFDDNDDIRTLQWESEWSVLLRDADCPVLHLAHAPAGHAAPCGKCVNRQACLQTTSV